MDDTPILLPTPLWHGLPLRLHAIQKAHQWQLAHRTDGDRDAYAVIVSLLLALNASIDDLEAIARHAKETT